MFTPGLRLVGGYQDFLPPDEILAEPKSLVGTSGRKNRSRPKTLHHVNRRKRRYSGRARISSRRRRS